MAIRTNKAINQALWCIGVVDLLPAVVRKKENVRLKALGTAGCFLLLSWGSGGGGRGGERDDRGPRRNNVYLSISSKGTRNKGLRRKTCILRPKPLATSPRFNTSKDTQKRRLQKLISPRNRKWLRFQPSGGATKFFLFFSLFFSLFFVSLSRDIWSKTPYHSRS